MVFRGGGACLNNFILLWIIDWRLREQHCLPLLREHDVEVRLRRGRKRQKQWNGSPAAAGDTRTMARKHPLPLQWCPAAPHSRKSSAVSTVKTSSPFIKRIYLRTVLQFCGELDRNASGFFPHGLKVACNIFLKCWGCRLFNSITF